MGREKERKREREKERRWSGGGGWGREGGVEGNLGKRSLVLLFFDLIVSKGSKGEGRRQRQEERKKRKKKKKGKKSKAKGNKTETLVFWNRINFFALFRVKCILISPNPHILHQCFLFFFSVVNFVIVIVIENS